LFENTLNVILKVKYPFLYFYKFNIGSENPGTFTSTGDYHVGLKYAPNLNTNMIVHSIRIHSSNTPAENDDLYEIVYNGMFCLNLTFRVLW
jgi:hypothetical protein